VAAAAQYTEAAEAEQHTEAAAAEADNSLTIFKELL
jgi:hypothetical protein